MAAVDFDRDIRPILSDRCYTCHGPDDQQRKSPLRFDTEDGAYADLNSGGKAIVPGDPAASKLIERITSDHPVLRMPPAYAGQDALPEAEIAKLRQWIAEGAPWAGHWSFQAPRRHEAPEVSRPDWVRTPIDAFVLAKLDAEGFEPSPEADRATLLRRLSLDLTGLPPTPEEVKAFLADETPGAYERQVDRLLASPRYGERMAVPWLDAARYADTNGYQSDGVREMWRWRDWVIDAFNQNKPFDEFTIEQLAGDLLPNPTRDQLIATGFHRNLRTTAEGGSVEEEFLAEYAAERAQTTGTVWLGLTVGCARCHDHKYDPISQKDFYELFAYFDDVPERGLVYNFGNDGPVVKAPTREESVRLAELEAAARKAEADWQALAAKVDAEQHAWEQAKPAGLDDEFLLDGLVARFSLDGVFEDLARAGVDDGERDLRSKPSEPVYGPGVLGKAAKLDGERWIDGGGVGGFDYDQPFTVSFWMRPDELEGGVISRMHDFATGSGWGVFLREGRLRFEFTMRHTDHSARVETQRAVKAGEWVHVAITSTASRPTYDGLTIRVNGEAWPFDVEWDDLKWPINYRGKPLRIGGAAGERFTGAIDEVRLYDRALGAEDVAALGVAAPLAKLAAKSDRTPAEQHKLDTAFLEQAAPAAIRRARFAAHEAVAQAARYEEQIPTVMVMKQGPERQAHVLRRGAYDAPGAEVRPAVLSALPEPPADSPPNRLGLARWLVSRDNPLTARVTVNRYWEMLFGVGLVKTAEDFGSQGERPSHPELLDWLAVEFMDSGWNIKALLKTMVMSNAYRQASMSRPDALQRDPENRLLWRGPRFRLPAEQVRDQALYASGLLVERVGGPSVKPYQPAGLWEEVSSSAYRRDDGDKLYRRSLYTYWKRTVPPPAMSTFDAPDRESCIVKRTRTNTPLQALTLMNDVTYLEAARKLAERMIHEGGETPDARIERGFLLALARRPTSAETAKLRQVLDGFKQAFGDQPYEAVEYLEQGESPYDKALDPVDLAAYASVGSLILNLDEAVTKE